MKLGSLLYDGQVAAKLGRLSWVVLVTAFALLMGAHLAAGTRDGLLALLAMVILLLNLPSGLGALSLWQQGVRSRQLSALTLVLGLRLGSLALVIWVIRHL